MNCNINDKGLVNNNNCLSQNLQQKKNEGKKKKENDLIHIITVLYTKILNDTYITIMTSVYIYVRKEMKKSRFSSPSQTLICYIFMIVIC